MHGGGWQDCRGGYVTLGSSKGKGGTANYGQKMTLKKQGNIQGSDSFAYQGRGGWVIFGRHSK